MYRSCQQPIANEGMTSGEVSFTTAEEVEELPIVLYSGIILMVVVFAAIIAVRATKETSKEYISEEADYPKRNPKTLLNQSPLSNKKNG